MFVHIPAVQFVIVRLVRRLDLKSASLANQIFIKVMLCIKSLYVFMLANSLAPMIILVISPSIRITMDMNGYICTAINSPTLCFTATTLITIITDLARNKAK